MTEDGPDDRLGPGMDPKVRSLQGSLAGSPFGLLFMVAFAPSCHGSIHSIRSLPIHKQGGTPCGSCNTLSSPLYIYTGAGAPQPQKRLRDPLNRLDSENRREIGSDPGEMLNQLRPRVYKYLRCRGLDADEANDLTSAVFERAIQGLASYNPARGAPNTWLFAIARNMLNSHWRTARLRKTLPLEAAEQQPGLDPPPEELIVRRETRQELIEALGSLDDRERDLIALKFSAFMTNRVIAGLTGLTESNVGVILFRAVRKLRALLSASTGGTR